MLVQFFISTDKAGETNVPRDDVQTLIDLAENHGLYHDEEHRHFSGATLALTEGRDVKAELWFEP